MADNVFVKNLESLLHLADFTETLDTVKLDAPPDLVPSELRKLHDDSDAAQKKVGDSKGDWRTATLDRQSVAEELSSKAAESLALLEGRGASAEKIEDGRFYVRKLQGKRASPKPVDDPATPDVDESESTISAAQTSNAARIATFLEYLEWLEPQSEYAGVKAAGKTVTEMRTFGESVEAKHAASVTAVTELSADRINRDKFFFDNDDSIINRAKRLKRLIGGAYGFDSPEYETANAFPFRTSNK